jgi:cellulose synthase (UDP-forming)
VFEVPYGGAATVRVFQGLDFFVYPVLTALNLAAVVIAARYWFGHWELSNPSVWIASLLLLPVLAIFELRWLGLPAMRRPLPPPPEPGLRVAAVTTFVPGAEPLEMLELTLLALVELEYPHESWVLDEGDDPRVGALCARLGARHFSRCRLPRYQTAAGRYARETKHGNYNAWLSEFGFEGYDVVVCFDPDHIPRRDYLTRVLGYLRDPVVGYVQPAQLYYNQRASFIARGAAEETYAFYSSVLMSTAAVGFPLLFGCHTVHRTSALRELGGLAAHDADDLLLGLRYVAAGWRGVYVPEPLAVGLTPVDWTGYLKQQRRWARSVLDIKLRHFPGLARALPRRARLAALVHGLTYLQGLLVPAGLLLLAYVLVSGKTPVPLHLAAAVRFVTLWTVLLLCELYRQRFYLLPRTEIGLHWRGMLLRFAKWPVLSLALLDVARHRRPGYELTYKVRRSTQPGLLLLPHLVVALVIISAWALGNARHTITYPLLDVAAGWVAVVSLAIFATGRNRFPAPFDRADAGVVAGVQDSP